MCCIRNFGFQPGSSIHCSFDGVSVIPCVVGKKQFSRFADQGQLRGSGTGIDPQIAVPAIGRKVLLFDGVLTVPSAEIFIFLLIPEKRFQAGHLVIDFYSVFQLCNQFLCGKNGCILLRLHRGTHGSKQM